MPETYAMGLLECPARVASRTPPGTVLQEGGTVRRGPRYPGDPTWEFHKGFQGSFQTTFESTFSNTRILVMPELFLKLRDCKNDTETLEATPVRVPRSSR